MSDAKRTRSSASGTATRRSSRPQRKRVCLDTFEHLGSDEEKALSAALKASLAESEPTAAVNKRRTREKAAVKIEAKGKTEKKEKGDGKEKTKLEPNPNSKRKKKIIKKKSSTTFVKEQSPIATAAPPLAQRKFAAVTANGRRAPSRRKPTPKPERASKAPTPPEKDSEDTPKTEEFVDYLCLRKAVPTKQEWKHFSGEEEDGLVIAESEESATDEGEEFKVFEFHDSLTEDDDNVTDSSDKPTNKRKVLPKKRRLTQQHYDAKQRANYLDTLNSVPVFRPTGEDFKNLHSYLTKMQPQLEECGMVKVIPPPGWKLPNLIQDDVRFTMCHQEIHRLYQRNGPTTAALNQIKSHLVHDHGFEWRGVPQIGSTPVDLARLSSLMKKHGGVQAVIDKRRWEKVADELRIPNVAERARQLEEIYCKYLLSYDLLPEADREQLKKVEIEEEIGGTTTRKMTLQALRRHDKNARKGKFPPDGVAATTTIEQDFWKVITEAEEHFLALKGLESIKTHGSGFPAYEPRHIAQSDWNLTNLRNLPDGVLGFLPDTNFITQPRLEFSSLYSASGWHVEPHFLPHICYNHLGSARVWYVSPESGRVLSALQEVAPRIGDGVGHVIDTNCLIVPPSEMIARDIKVCRAVQKPGEFIITAPKSYTASFNLGLNVVESVNFATEKWLNFTVDSVRLYQAHRLKPPLDIAGVVFDVIRRHDTLSERMLRETEPSLTALLSEELDLRKGSKLPRVSLARKGERRFCSTCFAVCHFSYAAGKAKDSPAYCLSHAAPPGLTVHCLVPDTDLREALDRLEKRLHPKRGIVHPVQALARSVCRPTPAPGSPGTSSPACPASPEEETAAQGEKGLDLVVPTQPLPLAVATPPVFTASSHTPTLARPIPIKPAVINPLKLLPSLLVHPQQYALPPSRSAQASPPTALWECYQP